MKTITTACVNHKGGVAKTTSLLNLAAGIARLHGKKVCICLLYTSVSGSPDFLFPFIRNTSLWAAARIPAVGGRSALNIPSTCLLYTSDTYLFPVQPCDTGRQIQQRSGLCHTALVV